MHRTTGSTLILQLPFRFKLSADINKVWWLHMHTFLPVCKVAFLGQPHQRLSPPTYWFIRGDLEPPCHMLPQMGTSPQAIQALWQQAWTIMDAKEKREKELCQPPRRHRFCVFTYAHMWIIKPLLLYVHVWIYVISVWLCASSHIHVLVYLGCYWSSVGAEIGLHLYIHWMQLCLPGQCREEGVKLWIRGSWGGGRGTISLLVTDSSMQTTFPQGRTREGGH